MLHTSMVPKILKWPITEKEAHCFDTKSRWEYRNKNWKYFNNVKISFVDKKMYESCGAFFSAGIVLSLLLSRTPNCESEYFGLKQKIRLQFTLQLTDIELFPKVPIKGDQFNLSWNGLFFYKLMKSIYFWRIQMFITPWQIFKKFCTPKKVE